MAEWDGEWQQLRGVARSRDVGYLAPEVSDEESIYASSVMTKSGFAEKYCHDD